MTKFYPGDWIAPTLINTDILPDRAVSAAGIKQIESFDLFDFLPMLYREADEADGSMQNLVWAFNQMWAQLLFDTESVPVKTFFPASTALVKQVCDQRGNPFQFLTEDQLRRVADNLVHIYKRRGDRQGLIHVVWFLLGIHISISQDYEYAWELGVARLGLDTILLGTYPSFQITIPGDTTVETKEQLKGIIQFMKPAHLSWMFAVPGILPLDLVSPTFTASATAFRVRLNTVVDDDSIQWTIQNGTWTAEDDPYEILVTPTSAAMVTVNCAATIGGVSASGNTNTQILALPTAILVADSEVVAGHGPLTAHLQGNCPASYLAITWSITNGSILSGQGTTQITYTAGEANGLIGQTTDLHCHVVAGIIAQEVNLTTAIHVLPYPYSYSVVTPALHPMDHYYGELSLGYRWLVSSLTSNTPIRLRLYVTSAQRIQDVSRVLGKAITGTYETHGQILEAVTTADELSLVLKPWAFGSTPTNVVYFTVDYLGTEDNTPVTFMIHTQKQN